MNLIFKKIAFWEGMSLLLLLFFAMPMKYFFAMPVFVKIIGMAHGVLFIVYVVIASLLFFKYKWKTLKFAIVLLASLIPFGTFYIERKYFKA
jgi:integral membrane protein